MTAKKRTAVPEPQLQRYERLVAAVPGAELKSNFGSSTAASVSGYRSRTGRRSSTRYGTELFRGDPSWPPAKEYVAVPDDLLDDTGTLVPYLTLSLTYAQGLRPKPTTSAK